MAVFQRPFNPDDVTINIVNAVLPDPLGEDALTHSARYPSVTIPCFVAEPAGVSTTIALSWPVTAAARPVDLPLDLQTVLGVDRLIELSPLPFGIANVLKMIRPGIPTFYLGYSLAAEPAPDSLVSVNDVAMDVGRVVMGCVFQDRMSLQPWAWIDIVGAALQQEAPGDAAGWLSMNTLFENQRSLLVRDPAGRPAGDETFEIRFFDPSDNVVRTETLISNEDGDLGPDALPQGNERAEISWSAVPDNGDEVLPVIAAYEASLEQPGDDDTRTYPNADPLILPSDFGSGHLQILDLAKWYAPVVVSPTSLISHPSHPWTSRFHGDSRLEPLVDGIATYQKLLPDIRAASGVHLSGWMFDDFPMNPYDPESSLSSLIAGANRDKFRILVTRSFLAKQGALDTTDMEVLMWAVMIMLALEPLIAIKPKYSDYKGFLGWHAIVLLIVIIEMLADPELNLEDTLRELVEFTEKDIRELLYDVSDGKSHIAFPAPHPVTMADNPVSIDFSVPGLGTIRQVQEMAGVYHHKFQVINKGDDTTPDYVGYLGGIDINANRLDAPGHHAARYRDPESLSPPQAGTYHDVHAKVTGPATRDMVGIFHERYHHALNFEPAGVVDEPLFQKPAVPPPPAFEPQTTEIAASGQHLVRIAQTSFKPAAGNEPFPWAPEGDSAIRETFERAIKQAREYIYIEEQYFTLDNGLIEILRQAANHCRRLVIVVAANTSDQLFGDQRRLATLERLAGGTAGDPGWGDRMIAGSPFRRPVLPPAQFKASQGRASLVEAIGSATTQKIYVAPFTRVPSGVPYFFWVGGELMFAEKASAVTSPGGHEAMELEVLRGGMPGTAIPWCPHPRPHNEGTPVTFAAPKDIFVHAKLLMVDDIFAAIGSCNWNRRGFYHDGEIDAFAIPDRLKASADNPALKLRTALWAEHLGLPPFMGRTLLADPIQAYELFRRSRYQGNRFAEHREFLAPRGDLDALNNSELLQVLPDSVKTTLLATMAAVTATQLKNLWNTIVDPTSELDPNPTPGPELPI